MKILLINPGMNLQKFGKFSRLMEPMPGIGLAYIASILEKDGFPVEVIDDFALHYGIEKIVRKARQIQPALVGISCLTPSASYVFKLAQTLKQNFPDANIALGNVHASYFADELLRQGIDVIIHGEGELPMLNLARAIRDSQTWDGLESISYKLKNGEIRRNKKHIPLSDLDVLSFPAWHLFPVEKYGLFPFADIKKPILTVLGSRGCPYQCSFCSVTYWGNKYRKRKPEKVVDEIEYLIDRFKIRQFGFVDAIFPLNKNDGLDFCREMVNRKASQKVIWTTETRPDCLDPEIIAALKEAGCRRLIFGIESGHQDTLNRIGKAAKIETTKIIIKQVQAAGLETIGLFMIGLPGESSESITRTINYATELDLDFAKFAIFVPFPGSRAYEDLRKTGWDRRDWENFSTFNPDPADLVYVPPGLSGQTLIELQKKAHRKFYFRLRMILRQFFRIRTIPLRDIVRGVYALLR